MQLVHILLLKLIKKRKKSFLRCYYGKATERRAEIGRSSCDVRGSDANRVDGAGVRGRHFECGGSDAVD